MNESEIITCSNATIVFDRYEPLYAYISSHFLKRILLVCGSSYDALPIRLFFSDANHEFSLFRFSDFEPNPRRESIIEGLRVFGENRCDSIIAIGGGSAIDVAKMIKYYSSCRDKEKIDNIFVNELKENPTLIVVPTTAGSGSEATRFAVFYDDGEKKSITDESILPNAVIHDPSLLVTLPRNQREATMFDALCHSIESLWSLKSNEESRILSLEAIREILLFKDSYLNNLEEGNTGMLKAAYKAGRAINIANTTAGHAMSYKLTTMFCIPHGLAVALCMSELIPYVMENIDRCIDPRGEAYLAANIADIVKSFECENWADMVCEFRRILNNCHIIIPSVDSDAFSVLKQSVNKERLKNSPILLNEDDFDFLYRRIVSVQE